MSRFPNGFSNADVKWEGTYDGLAPELTDRVNNSVSSLGEFALPGLIDALLDREVFVVVHVVLTRLTGIQYQTFPKWNHLAVELAADGTVTIDPEQRFDLVRRWKQWCQAKPRPSSLPQTTED